jgi:hypothetical protein
LNVPGILRLAFAAVALALAVVAAPSSARAACSEVDAKLATAQAALRAAEPARDATVADFQRRLGLVVDAYDATTAAETIRETTPGGCGDIQQLYNSLQTLAWTELVLAYLKPSIEYYMTDYHCVDVSQIQTLSAVASADETMNRSLISWNPFRPDLIATRDHVTRMVVAAAAYLHIPLPPPEKAEDLARAEKFRLDVARKGLQADCFASTKPVIPKAVVTMIVSGS